MVRVVSFPQNTAVDARVKGLDPSVEHFRKSRMLRNLFNLHPFFFQELVSSSRRQDFDAERLKSLGKFDDPLFIVYA
jgi:hypothetical protein